MNDLNTNSINVLNIWFPPEAWPHLLGVCCSLLDSEGNVICSTPMTGLAIVDGAADADDVNFGYVQAGPEVCAWRIHVGERGIARVVYRQIMFGGDVTIIWDDGPNRIFRLELP